MNRIDRKPVKEADRQIDTVAKALCLLDCFTAEEPELSLKQLSEKTGLYKSRIIRLCGTLAANGYVIRTTAGTYKLGPKLMILGKVYERANPLTAVARPIMKDLSALTGNRPSLGESVQVEARDTVTLAPELVRMTLNMAMTHTDAGRSVYGKRLVYGGHTISMASAQVTRVLPAIATTLGWYKCDHTGPVFEGDILSSSVTLESVAGTGAGDIGIVHVTTLAERGDQAPEPGADIPVLDWRFAVLLGKEK